MPQIPCPYCGQPHDSSDAGRCSNCNGLFEPLSQTATQLAMGPWYVRDEDRPFMPGFNEAILRQQVATGRITANTIVRGPTTNQFWMNAADTPGVSRLMGTCHACHQAVEPTDTTCGFCKADMSLPDDVDALGLKYTTDEARAQAQKEIAEGRVQPAPKPAPKPAPAPAPTPKPDTRPAGTSATVSSANELQSIEDKLAPPAPKPQATTPSPEPEPEGTQDDGNELTSALAEDVWHAGPTPGRRRKRKQNTDPLVIGMGVLLLCVFALGGFVLLTSGKGNQDDDTEQEDVVEAPPQRDSVAVSRVSVPALTVYERLIPEDIPSEFEDRYAAIRRLALRAEADKKAERYNEAYDAYQELAKLATPLENDIAQWQLNEQAKAEASEMRDRVTQSKQKAQAAEAERWAPKAWADGQTAWDQAEQLYTSGKFAEAGEQYTQAESTYLAAENKAQAGQLASTARKALMDAMASSAENTLRKFANNEVDAMFRLRSEADAALNDQEYAKAEQSYNNALDTLNDAKQIVELARYKKFYAFEAGFQASALMLGAARGDGVKAEAQGELVKLFEKLRILPNPAAGITPGDDVGFTIAINPLVNDARDAIIERHGEAVQACYLIGFHASIIDQTLKTIGLTDDQQKRIHQSLGTIQKEAYKAGWNTTQLGPVIEQVRTANRNAKLSQVPESTRAAWKRLLTPMQSRETAPRLMEPSTDPGDASDPELFPVRGS